MLTVSDDFKLAMKQPVKELQAFIESEDVSIRDDSDLISVKISGEGGLCKSVMRKLEAKYLGEHNLLGKWVSAGFGVKLPSGAFDFLKYGSFLVNELTISKDTGTTTIVAYDKMINAMKTYAPLSVEYPIGLYDYTVKLCEACGLELGSDYFGVNMLKSTPSYDWSSNESATLERVDDYIKVTMPQTPREYSGIYSMEVKAKIQRLLGKRIIFSFYAKADANRKMVFTCAGDETRIYVDLTPEWKRFSYVVDTVESFSPTFYCGITLESAPYYIKDVSIEESPVLTEFTPYNTMNDWLVKSELWETIDGITYRDIFVQIAQATASTCVIGADDKVYFKPITETGEKLTYDNMFKLKLEDKYGPINSVVLSRDPVEGEIVFKRDDASIEANGLTEFKISNNEIVDKNREDAITPIYEALHGTTYYPFEATTEGLGWYEIGDGFNIETDTGDVFSTALFNFSITLDGGIKETLKTVADTKTQSQYQYATVPLAKRIKNTEILVNKQDGVIQSLVSDVKGVKENYTKITQDVDKIVASVQNSGGGNLLKDSVMFAYANNSEQSPWTVSGDGTINIQSDTQSIAHGGASGHSFTLNNKTVKQKINVTVSADGSARYTFSTKIKKNATGSCYVKIYNDAEVYDTIVIPAGESVFYADYEYKALEPKEPYYYVEFYGSADSDATFTDNMFAVGENKSQWTQANGEVMNTNVVVDVNGITVKNVNEDGETTGDYTTITTKEFAGYSDGKQVFTLNKDVTEVEKLKAKKEVTMAPIKIVPVTSGDLQGWAFVPSTEV